jgi:hypothetical protein
VWFSQTLGGGHSVAVFTFYAPESEHPAACPLGLWLEASDLDILFPVLQRTRTHLCHFGHILSQGHVGMF